MGKFYKLPTPSELFGADYDKFTVGFDNLWNNVAKFHDDFTKNIPGYPPYNIRKVDENRYVVELAVAGFAKQDIEIILDGNKLTIIGNSRNDDIKDYLYQGIANRAFTRTFAVDDRMEVENAELFNGMLRVFLERIIPEHRKPKKIEVSDGEAPAKKKQFLMEGE